MRSGNPAQSSIFDVLDAPKVEKPQPERVQVQAPPIVSPEPSGSSEPKEPASTPEPKPRKATKPKAKSKAEREAEAAEKASAEQEKGRLRALGSQKLYLMEILDADPRVPAGAVEVLRSYLRFVNDFATDRPYRSLIDLQVDTGQSSTTIRTHKGTLAKLGYMVPDGKTSSGCIRYHIELSTRNENLVLDHKIIAKEKLLEDEAIRKESDRRKKAARVTDFDTLDAEQRVSEIDRLEAPEGDGILPDRVSDSDNNYPEEHPECLSIEGKDSPLGMSPVLNAYAMAETGGEYAHDFLQAVDDDEAIDWAAQYLETCSPLAKLAVLDKLRERFMVGITRGEVERIVEAARKVG